MISWQIKLIDFCLLTHNIFRLIVSQKCSALHCPTAGNSITKYRSSFSFTSESYHEQLHSHFTMPGDYNGYCSYEFCEEPPLNSESYLNNRIHLMTMVIKYNKITMFAVGHQQ